MTPYRGRLETAVPHSPEVRHEILRAAQTLADESEPARHRRKEIASIKNELQAIRKSIAELCRGVRALILADLRKYGYNPDEPRVPKHQAGGGEWTSDSSQLAQANGGALFGLPRRRGHHWVPKALYEDKLLNLRDETKKIFADATSGPLFDGRANQWSAEHAAYNDAVRELFINFLNTNRITADQMTPDQAKEFVQQVWDSKNPAIYKLKVKIIYEAARYFLIRGPRGEE